MSRNTVAEPEVSALDTSPESNGDEDGMVRYTESGRAVLVDPFEVLAEETEGIDLRTTPSIADRLAEAKKPVKVKSEEILGHDVVWLKWREQNALLTNEGTITEGYFALGRDLTTNRYITIFVGGIALCRTLRQLSQPFRAKLEQRGRTLVFA